MTTAVQGVPEPLIEVCSGCGKAKTCIRAPQVPADDIQAFTGPMCPICVLTIQGDPEKMRPAVFVARALLGQEPFKSLWASAQAQRMDPTMKDRRIALEEEKKRAGKALLSSIGKVPNPRNRIERRRLAAKQRTRRP